MHPHLLDAPKGLLTRKSRTEGAHIPFFGFDFWVSFFLHGLFLSVPISIFGFPLHMSFFLPLNDFVPKNILV
jgi:hypothetical protein